MDDQFSATAPPNSKEAEISLLASLIIDPDMYYVVSGRVTADSFYSAKHQHIFRAIEQLIKDDAPVEIVSLSNALKGSVQAHELVQIVSSTPSAANAEYHAGLVAEKHQRRQAINSMHKAIREAMEPGSDILTVITNVQGDLDLIDVKGETKEPRSLIDVVEHIVDNYRSGTLEKGIPTGLLDLDDLWAGFYPGELTVLAGRPSMGKSAMASYLTKVVATHGSMPALFFSLEMNDEQLGIRYLATEMGVDGDALRREKVAQQTVESRQSAALAEIAKAPVYIQDDPDMTTADIYRQAAKMKREKGLSLVTVDYLTLLTDAQDRNENYALQVTRMTRRMAAMAKKLHIPVLLLSQLSRKTEGRENRRPTMSDVKESGGIEERADNILLLYREKYYNPEKVEDILEIIVAKQKQGPRGLTAKVMYQAELGRFLNISHQEEPQSWQNRKDMN